MSNRLVKRLRNWEHVHPEDENKAEGSLYLEAADRIEELEALKAAIERTKEVPVGPTLVDQISDEDWKADASDWNINAGAGIIRKGGK